MTSDEHIGVVIAFSALMMPVIIAAAYALVFGAKLRRRRRFVAVAAWLSFGVYGALLALTLPLEVSLAVAQTAACRSSQPGNMSTLCVVTRELYSSGFLLGIIVWLGISMIVTHMLAHKYWNRIAMALANES